jgi:mannose-6-phosphate isomerase-like protein (cupin superfamily)
VAGELEVVIDGRRSALAPGQTAHIPPDTIHATANPGSTLARRIVIFSPAGMEEFFLEVGAASEEAEIDPRRALASALRHGWEFS